MLSIFLSILVVVFAIIIGFISLGLTVIKGTKQILTYSTFKTPCEVALEYCTKHRLIGAFIDAVFPECYHAVLAELETHGEVTGRSPPRVRCECEREYALSLKTRKRRRKKRLIERIRPWWDEQVPQRI